jgi:hypothetical protein
VFISSTALRSADLGQPCSVAGSEPSVTSNSNCPGIELHQLGEKDLNLHNLVQSQAAYR